MVDMKPRTPAAGLLPIAIGKVKVEEVDLGHLTSLSPLGAGMAEALEKAHGLAWPEPGRSSGTEGARAIWFGLREVMLIGPEPAADLTGHGAVVDQSDAWCAVALEGEASEAVLARLVPVDLRAAHFKEGQTVRTSVFHMNASITRVGPNRFLILVFRSMAVTLVHDLKQAMAAVAARG
ncbi:MAG: sarcosine oxidase subunit gamma [Sulfitobacter sp.]|nr:sarcosine oxidase subunit gamma [Sulfitobacter sp.]